MDIQEIRIARLKELVIKIGGNAEFARSLDADEQGKPLDPSYISQLLTKKRSFGEKAARKLELRARLPSGYFDLADVENIAPGPLIRGMSPLISSIRAGTWGEARDPFRPGDAEDWYPMPKKAGPNTYCLRVEGDSMTAPYGKSYPDGSIIFVDPDRRSPANGERIVAKLRGEPKITFKVFVREAKRIWLKPLNPQHPPITEEFKVIGTVIGKWEDE